MHVVRGVALLPSSLQKFFHEQMTIILVLQNLWEKNVVPHRANRLVTALI